MDTRLDGSCGLRSDTALPPGAAARAVLLLFVWLAGAACLFALSRSTARTRRRLRDEVVKSNLRCPDAGSSIDHATTRSTTTRSTTSAQQSSIWTTVIAQPPTPPNQDDAVAVTSQKPREQVPLLPIPTPQQEPNGIEEHRLALPPLSPASDHSPTASTTPPHGDTTYSGQRDAKTGLPHGRGVMTWPSGDRYEGEFQAGFRHGQGTLIGADGSLYFGGWQRGEMHGNGVFRPPSSQQEASETKKSKKKKQATAVTKPQPRVSVVYYREYADGKLLRQVEMKTLQRTASKRKPPSTKAAKKAVAVEVEGRLSSQLSSRPLAPGEVVYKGHKSYDLMRQLQLGIMYSLAQGGLDGYGRSDARTLKKDYWAAEVQYFPSGSGVFESTLPGFKWKDYAPRAFHRLRELFGVDPADYLISLTGGPALRELPSPGASGAIFFLSQDDRYMIKSVRKEEMEALLSSTLRRYCAHVEQTRGNTLLVRFFGIHRLRPWLGRNARFVVMGNVLPSGVRMHRKFDLKGSTYKRTVGEERRKNDPSVALKDLDLDMKFELPRAQHEALLQYMGADVSFLQDLGVIDYSLLLGVHFVRWRDDEWYPPYAAWPDRESDFQHPSLTPASRQQSILEGTELAQTLSELSMTGVDEAVPRTAATIIAQANSIRQAARLSAASASHSCESDGRGLSGSDQGLLWQMKSFQGNRKCALVDSRLKRQASNSKIDSSNIGWEIPAVAVHKTSSGNFRREPVLLYFGIIDFLQKYTLRKVMERVWKATLHGPSVSVADPITYGKRFKAQMERTFIVEGQHLD